MPPATPMPDAEVTEAEVRRAKARLVVLAVVVGLLSIGFAVRPALLEAPPRRLPLPLEVDVIETPASAVGGDLESVWVDVPEHTSSLVVRLLASGQACPATPDGLPIAEVDVDGRRVRLPIDAVHGAPRAYQTESIGVEPGQRRVVVRFVNDYYESDACDRNLRVHRIFIARTAA